jgi:hypothetical protein
MWIWMFVMSFVSCSLAWLWMEDYELVGMNRKSPCSVVIVGGEEFAFTGICADCW